MLLYYTYTVFGTITLLHLILYHIALLYFMLCFAIAGFVLFHCDALYLMKPSTTMLCSVVLCYFTSCMGTYMYVSLYMCIHTHAHA